MVLINIIDILSKDCTIHIGVNGYIVDVFKHVDEIPYKYLNLCVKRIYPIGVIENTHEHIDGITGLDPVAPKGAIGLDLVTFDNEED